MACRTFGYGHADISFKHMSTILAADKILVFDKGKLVQQGNHEQLMKIGGLYRTLYDTQFKI